MYRVSELCEELNSDQQLVRTGQDWLHEGAIWSKERVEEMVTGACGILTDWGKLQNIKEVSARDVDIAQSNTVDRSGVAV
jgi:hypothetical protein